MFFFGYAAFSTNINMSAKENLKNIDKKVDSKISMSELLFWGQADNKDNTFITLKNKVSTGTDGAMHGFQNDFLSGYNDGNISFDGNDDYIDIGLTNYDFKNTVSYIVYVKLNNIEKHQIIFGSWEGEKGASGIYFNNRSCFSFASMSLKEVMLYDRVLTENEAIDITKGFEKNIVCRTYRKILHLHELTKI